MLDEEVPLGGPVMQGPLGGPVMPLWEAMVPLGGREMPLVGLKMSTLGLTCWLEFLDFLSDLSLAWRRIDPYGQIIYLEI